MAEKLTHSGVLGFAWSASVPLAQYQRATARNGLRPDPDFVNINQIESTASERSQALTLTLQGRVAKPFKTYTQYIFSHTTHDTSGTFSLPANNYDLRAERGPAEFDLRHHFH